MNEEILKSNWPIVVFAALVLVVNVLMILVSYFAGEKHRERDTDEIYESGISVTGDARLKFSAHFYIIAMFFVIFDVESLFIISWSLVFRDTGWTIYWGMFVFIMVLLVVVAYEWKTGALDFGPKGKKILKAYHEINKKENPQ